MQEQQQQQQQTSEHAHRHQHPLVGPQQMTVTKRSGSVEYLFFDKILNRIRKLGEEVGVFINYQSLVIKIVDQLYDKIATSKIDELTAEQCAGMSTLHPDYATLAGRIAVSNHQKNTEPRFSDVIAKLHRHAVISDLVYHFVALHADALDAMIESSRDYLIDYFGFKTLEKSYLLALHGVVVERPQHMWMRVAVGIHGIDCSRDVHCPVVAEGDEVLRRVQETYDLLSQKYFTHATPTLFNAGTTRSQLSSCYLLGIEEDSIEGIFNTLKDTALISKVAGGVGLHIHNVRSKGATIRASGASEGIGPMLRVFNNVARYVNQGNKRNGSFAVYLEPWHADIELFLEMRKNHGDEDLRARDLFYALWIPDLFMERVKAGAAWTLFCPAQCPGLSEVHGAAFDALYLAYEARPECAKKTVAARDLWYHILDAQMETGTPYLLYKDACNRKSNQQHLGTIRSSNLCAEIVQFSDEKESAVCNLASIALPAFVDSETRRFDFDKLHRVTKVVVNNLNATIDINFYPTPKTRRSNLRHRPVGVGVQGLADTFVLMDLAFCSDAARQLNLDIAETMYHAALEQSNDLARERTARLNACASRAQMLDSIHPEEYEFVCHPDHAGVRGSHPSFPGSPASQGRLQFDLWGVTPAPGRYDWADMKRRIQRDGLRNSLLIAAMPTASTSQILGYNECIEPFTSNIYSRRTLAGEFVVVNKYLMKELIALGLWSEQVKNNIVANKGSIQQLTGLPAHIRDKYRTVWELPMKRVIDMSADRGAFVCQSQSLNLWMEEPTYTALTSMHFYAWQKGLKTGMYYLRRKARHHAQQFTIEPTATAATAMANAANAATAANAANAATAANAANAANASAQAQSIEAISRDSESGDSDSGGCVMCSA